jgi:hypothetical protein
VPPRQVMRQRRQRPPGHENYAPAVFFVAESPMRRCQAATTQAGVERGRVAEEGWDDGYR